MGGASLRERAFRSYRHSLRRRWARSTRTGASSAGGVSRSAGGAAVPMAAHPLEEIRTEIDALQRSVEPGVFSGWGVGRGAVNIRLRADQEPLAHALYERYGNAVELVVGWLHYPDGARSMPVGSGSAKSRHPAPESLPNELSVSLDDDLVVRSGDNLKSTIRLHNHGQDDVVVLTNGQVTAPVVDPELGARSGDMREPNPCPWFDFVCHRVHLLRFPCWSARHRSTRISVMPFRPVEGRLK